MGQLPFGHEWHQSPPRLLLLLLLLLLPVPRHLQDA
jgi:hypothetical protein